MTYKQLNDTLEVKLYACLLSQDLNLYACSVIMQGAEYVGRARTTQDAYATLVSHLAADTRLVRERPIALQAPFPDLECAGHLVWPHFGPAIPIASIIEPIPAPISRTDLADSHETRFVDLLPAIVVT